jgi:hypothetical protein
MVEHSTHYPKFAGSNPAPAGTGGKMRLCLFQDGSTFRGYKLMCFVYISHRFCEEQNTLAFNRDTWCPLALCLLMMLLHWKEIKEINK